MKQKIQIPVLKIQNKLFYFANLGYNFQNKEIINITSGKNNFDAEILFSTPEYVVVSAISDNANFSANTEVELSIGGTTKTFKKLYVDYTLAGKLLNHNLETVAEPKTNLIEIPGLPRVINPLYREPPNQPLLTGFALFDFFNTLSFGQKIAIFRDKKVNTLQFIFQLREKYLQVDTNNIFFFTGLGLTSFQKKLLQNFLDQSEYKSRIYICATDLPNDPSIQILGLHNSLRASEYLSETTPSNILHILFDISTFYTLLQEQSFAKGELPGQSNSAPSLYSELRAIYETSGKIKGQTGSLTLIPVVLYPFDDPEHLLVDITGYITEGQILLSRELEQKGLPIPVEIMGSLSRLMKSVIGEGKTFPEHMNLSNELILQYAEALIQKENEELFGKRDFSEKNLKYLAFYDAFLEFVGFFGTLEEMRQKRWQCLMILDPSCLKIIGDREIKKYLTF
jgi:V/A-type H+-transporting ATPase subunit B